MSNFVHGKLGHFLMEEIDGEGNDLGGAEEVVEEQEEEPADDSKGEDEPEEEAEVVVTIGDEQPDEEEEQVKSAPEWVRNLRKEHKEAKRRIKELETQAAQAKPKEEVPAVGPKPTLEDCDYDAEEFEKRYDAWLGRKQKAEAAQREKEREAEEATKAWQQTLDGYKGAKEKLKVRDYDDAEELVVGTLGELQLGIILQGADNAALVVYALGKNPKKAAELASIKDTTKFAFAIAKLEAQLKVQNRKPATKPESTVSGTGPKSGAVDNQLERLRAEAEKSGDYSKVRAYKSQLKQKQQARA